MSAVQNVSKGWTQVSVPLIRQSPAAPIGACLKCISSYPTAQTFANQLAVELQRVGIEITQPPTVYGMVSGIGGKFTLGLSLTPTLPIQARMEKAGLDLTRFLTALFKPPHPSEGEVVRAIKMLRRLGMCQCSSIPHAELARRAFADLRDGHYRTLAEAVA